MKLRVSFIDFLNSVPLGWGFLYGSERGIFDVALDVPSRCAERLRDGLADIGLIPAIEYQRIPGLRILPDLSIASKKEVKSVLFISREPLGRVRRVALDTSSRTSVALLKILLSEFHGNTEVEYFAESPDAGRMLDRYDAALIIGNPALSAPVDRYPVYDLAAEWNRFTGLPFVFAFWAVRPGVELESLARVFYASRSEGLRSIDQIARLYGPRLGLEAGEVRSYILKNLDYSLDEENLKGLQTYYRLAHKLGLIPRPRPLEFIEPEVCASLASPTELGD